MLQLNYSIKNKTIHRLKKKNAEQKYKYWPRIKVDKMKQNQMKKMSQFLSFLSSSVKELCKSKHNSDWII